MSYRWKITFYRNSRVGTVEVESDVFNLYQNILAVQVYDYEIISIEKV